MLEYEKEMAWGNFALAMRNKSAVERYAHKDENSKKSWSDFAKEVREKKYKATRTSSYFSL